MVGVLLVSHGIMAKGMADAAALFFGDDIPQFGYLCLEKKDNPSDFGGRIKQKIADISSGDGVYILADLFGGTPCNQSMLQTEENVEIIAGMNLAIVLELLSQREAGAVNINELVEVGRESIKNAKQAFGDMMDDDKGNSLI